MPNPVTHFEITGKDGKKLQDYYSRLFGWKVDAGNPMDYGEVEAQEGHGIGGGIAAAGDSPHSGVTVYVEVDNPQTYLDKAASLGGKIIMPVTVIPDTVTFALFADPEGHVVGIVKADQPH
jgi:predicted enzyme related to lactoylglutathione lyase